MKIRVKKVTFLPRHPRRTEVARATDSGGERPEPGTIARAAQLIRDGGLVAFPTETVYGLGANALSAEAVARIFEAKGRPSHNPVIVHVPDAAAAMALVIDWTDEADRLAGAFWPGPLTLVLPKRDIIPQIVSAGGPTVGIRVPAHPVALALLRAAGVPVAAPSANRSMQLSPTTAQHVLQSLDGRIDMILDGGPTTGGIESTVVSLAHGQPRLLRPGLITPAQLEAVIGPIDRNMSRITQQADEENQRPTTNNQQPRALPSPGMLARHYAPRAALEVTVHGEQRVHELLATGNKVGWLTFSPSSSEMPCANRLSRIEMPDQPYAYASKLYAALHALDDYGVSYIVADSPPPTDDWLALRDRLYRAATPA